MTANVKVSEKLANLIIDFLLITPKTSNSLISLRKTFLTALFKNRTANCLQLKPPKQISNHFYYFISTLITRQKTKFHYLLLNWCDMFLKNTNAVFLPFAEIPQRFYRKQCVVLTFDSFVFNRAANCNISKVPKRTFLLWCFVLLN